MQNLREEREKSQELSFRYAKIEASLGQPVKMLSEQLTIQLWSCKGGTV